jgi:hypothetical protein
MPSNFSAIDARSKGEEATSSEEVIKQLRRNVAAKTLVSASFVLGFYNV